MFAISWLGFMPQVNVIVLGLALALQLARLRREALCVLIAAAGLAVAGLIKLIIARPRPSPDLVHVLRTLSSSGFPSGHVLETTAVCGYLAYVAWQLLKPSLGRSALITALGVLIALMGVSRIQQGQHWFSDVCGAYLLGSLWLSFTIRIHQRGRPVTAPSSRP